MFLVMAASVAGDVRAEKIPNGVLATGVLLYLAGALWHRSFPEALPGFLAGAFLPFLLLFPLFLLRMLGAGDVKLLMVVGALVGWPGSLMTLALAFLYGAALALAKMLWNGCLGERIGYFVRYARDCFVGGGRRAYLDGELPTCAKLHFSVPVALGTLTYVALLCGGRMGSLTDVISRWA